jgi:hypothetical protein
MFISKDKERVISLTNSTIIIVIAAFTILTKDTFLRVKLSDTFSGDRKKFKVYEL